MRLFLKLFSSVIFGVILLGLIAIGCVYGSLTSLGKVFYSWWFVSLEILLVISILVCSVKQIKKIKRLKTFGAVIAHLGVLIILFSALIRFMLIPSGEVVVGGEINILEGESATTFSLTKKNITKEVPLGFEIVCRDFIIENIPGTSTPSNYKSEVEIIDGENCFVYEISLNNPLKYRGFNIHQSTYKKVSGAYIIGLGVSRDPTMWIVFIGAMFLVFSTVLVLFKKIGVKK